MFDETPHDAFVQRFGHAPGASLPELEKFLNHRSVRAFAETPIPRTTIVGLMAAAQSAATSSGLQMWSAISVQDPSRREAIALLCGDQKQVRGAGWFFAFCADHYRIRQAAASVGEEAKGLSYAEFMLIAAIDAALAAERMVCAAESLGLGTCYVGALRNRPADVAELLALPKGVFGLFGLCLGVPAEPMTAAIKPRFQSSQMFFEETYPASFDFAEYDARMQAFSVAQNMKGDATWSMRMGKRVDEHHMSGREILKEYLADQGFWRN